MKKGDPQDVPIDNAELARYFGQWGELKRIGDNQRSGLQKFVQFFDTRALEPALKATATGVPFAGGTLTVEEAKSNSKPVQFRGADRGRERDRYPPRDRRRSMSPGHRPHRSSSSSSTSSSSRRRRSRERSPVSRKRHSRSRSPRGDRDRDRDRNHDREREHEHDRRKQGRTSSPPPQRYQAAPSGYGAPPPSNAHMGYYGGNAPAHGGPGAPQEQVLHLIQQNPQLLSMLVGMAGQHQQQQPVPMHHQAPPLQHQQAYVSTVGFFPFLFLSRGLLFATFFVTFFFRPILPRLRSRSIISSSNINTRLLRSIINSSIRLLGRRRRFQIRFLPRLSHRLQPRWRDCVKSRLKTNPNNFACMKKTRDERLAFVK